MARMQAMRTFAMVAVVGFFIGGCDSGRTLGSDDGGGSGGSGGTGGKPVYGGGCPNVTPAQGTSCPRSELVCEYGDDPRRNCHTRAECDFSKRWNVIEQKCDPIPPAMCPATRDDAAGKSCGTKDAVCDYAGLACRCSNCRDYPVPTCGGPLVWMCDAPSPDPKCPMAAAKLGTRCPTEGQSCQYACDLGRKCAGGIWVDGATTGCPISVRRAKTNIRYLTEDDRRRLAAQVNGIRLATYRYTDPASGPGEHLGFIIDDSPGIPAVDAGGGRVDLYGYASMAVAAVQAQAQEIALLKREIQRLKARLER